MLLRRFFAAIAVAASTSIPLLAAEPVKLPSLEPIKTDAEIKPVAAKVVVVENVVVGKDAFPKAMAAANAAYAKTRDYSAYMVREERVDGKLLPAQTAELRVRCEPFSLYSRTVAPKALLGQELAFVSGRKEDMVRVKLAGTAGGSGFQSVELTDAKASVDSKYGVTGTGIGAVLKRIDSALEAEKTAKTKPEFLVADYEFDGKACTRFDVICERSHTGRFAAKFVVYFDSKTALPVRFEAYDQPKKGNSEGELLECVSFVSLKFNSGLGDGVFDK